MRGFAIGASMVLGCYHPSFATDVPCGADGACPAGQVCDYSREPPRCVTSLNPNDSSADTSADAPIPRLETCGDPSGLQARAPWPVIHGCPTNNGRSSVFGPATGATAIAPTGTNNAGRGAVVGTGNQIVVQERSAGDVFGFDGTNGMQRWSFLDTAGAGVEPYPVLDNQGQIFLTTNYGKLYCIDYASGGAKWDLQFGGAFSAPVIAAPGIVYFGSVGPYGFYAIDVVAKMQKWHYDVPNMGDASTAPAIGADKVYFVDTKNSRLFALDLSSGAHLFDVPIAGQAIGSAVLAVDAVYVATRTNGIAAFDAETGALKWQQPAGLDVVQPALLATGYLVSSTRDGNAFILDRTGSQQVSIALGGKVNTPPRIDAADVIYFATDLGTRAYTKQAQRWQSQLIGPIVLGDQLVVVLPAQQLLAAIGP